MNFCSDNVSGASQEIVDAVAQANQGAAMPYGADPLSDRLRQRFNDIFETEVAVFPVATGTAANALALSVMAPPYGAILCLQESHAWEDECGAPEFYSGAKLVPLAGEHGKLTPDNLQAALGRFQVGFVHHSQPAAVTLSQATEAGTIYSVDEIRAISALCRKRDLKLHMDGARFANALVSLGCSPAEATWRAGLDALSFGATKNGALAAEAVVLFDQALAGEFGYRRKRAGHLWSKMRFLSVQLEAYLNDDLWLRNAGHANAMAARLAAGLADLPDAELLHPVQANELFMTLPPRVSEGLLADGFQFYPWAAGGPHCVRLVTAFNTSEQDVEAMIAAAHRYAAAAKNGTVDDVQTAV